MKLLVNGEIVLYGAVGDGFWVEGFSDHEVIMALAELTGNDEIVVRVNSGGGDAYMGIAIYNALKASSAKIIMYVDGLVASAASVFAMAADELVMNAGSVMMIHDPAAFAFGDVSDLEKSVESLDKLGDQGAVIYAQKATTHSADEIRVMMKEETWFTADEAVEAGFADRSDASVEPVAAMIFDYSQYTHAPVQLVEMAKANEKIFIPPSNSATSPRKNERNSPMAQATDTNAAVPENEIDIEQVKRDASSDAQQRILSITTCDESDGKSDLAAHLAFQTNVSVDEAKGIMMSGNKKAAQDTDTKPAKNSNDNPKMLDGVELMDNGQSVRKAPKLSIAGVYEKRAADAAKMGA